MELHFSALAYSYAHSLGNGSLCHQAMLETIKNTGFDGVDLDFNCLKSIPAIKLKQELSKLDLSVPSLAVFSELTSFDDSTRKNAVKTVFEATEYAKEVGAKNLLIVAGFTKPDTRNQARLNVIKGLKECLDHIISKGLTPTIETFPGDRSPFITGQEVLEVCNALDGKLMVTFDVGNSFTGGEDPIHTFELLQNITVHIHAKNWIVKKEPPSNGDTYCRGLDGNYYIGAELSEGILPIAEILDKIQLFGYNDYIGWEYEGSKEPQEASKKGLDFLRKYIKLPEN